MNGWRGMVRSVAAALSLLALASALRAEDLAARFESANRLYEQGRFAEAAAAYEAILSAGRASAALYFNLGNARFKSGQIGRALAAYRRAAERAPRDPDVQANLRFVREQVASPGLQPGRLERWLNRLSLNEWTGLVSGAFWVTLLSLATRQLRPRWGGAMRWVGRIGGATTLVCGLALGWLWMATARTPLAIVTVPETLVRNGPFEESPEAFRLTDGAELRVLDQKEDWLEVSDGRRRPGWVRREAVLLLRPWGSEV